jgi:hypothetical protein
MEHVIQFLLLENMSSEIMSWDIMPEPEQNFEIVPIQLYLRQNGACSYRLRFRLRNTVYCVQQINCRFCDLESKPHMKENEKMNCQKNE